ncbi:MAG: DUF1501 domain-containing protein [bacterium]|nr:DUF1501 domain-containing protein [bacterium]
MRSRLGRPLVSKDALRATLRLLARSEGLAEKWVTLDGIGADPIVIELDADFGLFDTPDAGQACPERTRSTTALQALSLFNSAFVAQQSRHFAERLEREAGASLEAQVEAAFRPAIDRAAPTAPRPPHFAGRAKCVVMIFCSGACSHVDTWDHKPALVERDGEPLRGECGKFTSDLLPHLGALVDDMCFVHSMTSRTNTHGPGENFMSTGFTQDGFPSVGAWASYAHETTTSHHAWGRQGEVRCAVPVNVPVDVADPRDACPRRARRCWDEAPQEAAFGAGEKPGVTAAAFGPLLADVRGDE